MLGLKNQKNCFALKALRVDIRATKGFESAEVVGGGGSRESEPKKLMSQPLNNLYFVGSTDIDGDCGV